MRCAHLQMSIAWHKNMLLLVGAFRDYSDNAFQRVFNLPNLVHEPEPHIGHYLIISRSASVQLSSDRSAYKLAQSPFVGSVDILIIGLDFELWHCVSPTLQTPPPGR